jgi:chemotaxis family two-component system response regulator Rcp1
VVSGGKEAITYLQQGKGFIDAPRPDLILLDLELPGMNGYEILDFIKKDNALRSIPVIIFSTVDTDESHWLADSNSANSYTVKPADFDTFIAVVQAMAMYWSHARQFVSDKPVARRVA